VKLIYYKITGAKIVPVYALRWWSAFDSDIDCNIDFDHVTYDISKMCTGCYTNCTI